MADGWCPFALQHRGYPGEGPFGYPAGTRGQNMPTVFCDHRMGGYKRTLDSDVWRHANWVGVHAGVGRDGSIDQYASILDAAWGNGTSGDPNRFDRRNPRMAAWESEGQWIDRGSYWSLDGHGVNIPNVHSISMEHEDQGIDQPWTPAMIDATIRFKLWCLEELKAAGRPMKLGLDMIIGHFQIDAVNRPGCPGNYWPKPTILAFLLASESTGGDELKSFLAWCPDRTATYFVGPNGCRWITDAAVVAELEKVFGKLSVTLSGKAIDAIGIAK